MTDNIQLNLYLTEQDEAIYEQQRLDYENDKPRQEKLHMLYPLPLYAIGTEVQYKHNKETFNGNIVDYTIWLYNNEPTYTYVIEIYRLILKIGGGTKKSSRLIYNVPSQRLYPHPNWRQVKEDAQIKRDESNYRNEREQTFMLNNERDQTMRQTRKNEKFKVYNEISKIESELRVRLELLHYIERGDETISQENLIKLISSLLNLKRSSNNWKHKLNDEEEYDELPVNEKDIEYYLGLIKIWTDKRMPDDSTTIRDIATAFWDWDKNVEDNVAHDISRLIDVELDDVVNAVSKANNEAFRRTPVRKHITNAAKCLGGVCNRIADATAYKAASFFVGGRTKKHDKRRQRKHKQTRRKYRRFAKLTIVKNNSR
jgi:hypothetical protein